MARLWIVLLAGLVLCADPALAQKMGKFGKAGRRPLAASSGPERSGPELPPGLDPEVVGAFFAVRADLEAMRARGLVPTGLVPVYPDDAQCPAMDSGFASRTRGDGSRRSPRYFQGLHSGMDIPVPEGTPILAVADGIVVHLSEGFNIGGLGVVVMHAPEDTGLAVWIFSEYKHLRQLPDLSPGQRVKMGQALAEAGVSGTTGGHYGDEGHSHLHLAVYASPDAEYRAENLFFPPHGSWSDPLALYFSPFLDSASLAALPDQAKQVRIAYMRPDGTVSPPGARFIWPFACVPR